MPAREEPMRIIIPGHRLGLLLAALALGACDDAVTGPAARTPADLVADAGRLELFPGTMKYRDEGHRPVTGRAGGATITTRALLDRHGAAEVEVYAGALGGTGPGELSKVQLKRFTLAGEHQSTENHNGLATRAITLSLLRVERNTPIQVQANVRGVAGARTGVVTVADVVKLRPDLTVLGVTAPSSAPMGVPVHVDAVVQEINGDVGARATCVLDANGAPVDSATGIWVDAGGMVTCEFVHTFMEPGTAALRVRLTSVDPGDYDTANDGAETTIRLFDDVPFTSWSAYADSGTFNAWTEHSWDLPAGGGTHESFRTRNERRGVSQSAAFSAYIRHPIAFPAAPLTDVALSQATGGSTVHAATFPVLAAEDSSISSTSSRWCVARESAGEVVTRFSVCTFRNAYTPPETWYTWVQYDWNAGDVTYHSLQSHILQCMPGSSSGCWRTYPFYSSWGWNTTEHTVTGRLVPFGSDYSIAVSLMSGDQRFAVTAVMPLSYLHSTSGMPLACTTVGWTNWPYSILGYGYLSWCDGSVTETWTLHGSTSG
jgi:hypothetical protein